MALQTHQTAAFRRVGGVGPYGLAVGLMLLVTAGCMDPTTMDNPQALFVPANTLVSSRTQCQVRAGAREYRLRGIMDVAVTNTYYMFPQIMNNLPESMDLHSMKPEDLRLSNNWVTVIGARVDYDYDYESDFGQQVMDDIEAFRDRFQHASGGIGPGEVLPTMLPIIPWELGNAFARAGALRDTLGGAGVEINVRVVVEGVLADHRRVRSNEFWFPLTVCNGCLVYFPPFVDCTRLEETPLVPCFPGQDDGVDCRLCYAYAQNDEARDRCQWLPILSGAVQPLSGRYEKYATAE